MAFIQQVRKYIEGYGITTARENIIPVVRATHHRKIEFIKNCDEPYFIVTDTLESLDNRLHAYRIYFHFNPMEARLANDVLIEQQTVTTTGGHIIIESGSNSGQWTSENRVVHNSSLYGNVSRAATACYTVHSVKPKTIISFRITPYKE
ncbi:hypothetical protein ACFL27_19425 [candidate division CSSED10-310 bacterium]|uniref:Uncharacterized protein n=1 Tax=candidate division CSSED10-310 bacterium TaxID=2855610 RepID=A0ABV6Z1T7_UNCC1